MAISTPAPSQDLIRAMARHNRVLALKLRATQGAAQDRMGLVRMF